MAAAVEIASKSDQPMPLSLIAQKQNISLSYLEQLFNKLKKSNLVSSVKGPGGGYVLAKSPEQIKIFDIIAAVEPIKMTRCGHKKISCLGGVKSRCQTHQLWCGLEENINNYLKSVSISDVANTAKL